MFKILKNWVIFFLALFLNISVFALNVNFTNPTSTPAVFPPDLSIGPGNLAQITTDSTGSYVYAVWNVSGGDVQVAISSDSGQTWQNPTTTPGGSPALSTIAGVNAQITTDSSGQYVYAVWRENVISGKIQVAISSDFGVTWISRPDLSLTGQGIPQITTDSSGQYVYAVWIDEPVAPPRTRVAISSDFGVTWANPASTPVGTPDLSDNDSFGPQITTDSSGKYVYAVWEEESIPQVANSSDFGQNWTYPVSTPAGTPDLASRGIETQVTTNSSGRYVYAVWRNDSTGVVQVAISSDFGQNWIYPTTTPAGTPDLAASGLKPQITTDNTGRYVYAVWYVSGGAVQVAISSNFGVTWTNPTTTLSGTPDLVALGVNPQITTDSSGRYVYAVWNVPAGGAVEVGISTDFGLNWTNPTTTPPGTPDLSTGSGNLAQITTDSSGRYVYAVWNVSGGAVQTATGFKTFFPIQSLSIKN